ncbi:hypothetical protein NDK47_05540 [Brevibacillus ruminantium]|uniref:Uncharacterized protein n=1 Tax=Brevibacillus ruminantium TaxID=2950604 RepID=A0ABY4WQ58_9BACL|nr:hypothetical protein [Brevibacillus ruminantium]USG66761.1 hypothetical protein NDK47_05540 [Brevibacillus ruminantium]
MSMPFYVDNNPDSGRLVIRFTFRKHFANTVKGNSINETKDTPKSFSGWESSEMDRLGIAGTKK